jgi:hypothetical protein
LTAGRAGILCCCRQWLLGVGLRGRRRCRLHLCCAGRLARLWRGSWWFLLLPQHSRQSHLHNDLRWLLDWPCPWLLLLVHAFQHANAAAACLRLLQLHRQLLYSLLGLARWLSSLLQV